MTLTSFVLAPEGYNGKMIRFHAEPVKDYGDGTVDLRCAEPGMEGLIAWRRKSDLIPVKEA